MYNATFLTKCLLHLQVHAVIKNQHVERQGA